MSSELGAKERIQILLAEYNSMRAQIIARGTAIIQILTIGVAAIGAIAAWLSQQPYFAAVVVLLTSIGITVISRLTFRYLDEEAAHVRALEKRINVLVGEELLTWELNHGRAGGGYWHGFFARKNH
ncbi:hypothetical protein ACQR1N_30910 [Bradyrhizobium sp. HKCCYLRH1073]|uniref:hypothetical protein n=1 Tax=unclassified Bradyrhizobium TaxID=2631580 RepID=UPI002915F6D7|nr:hypothetical protein [Bradyrhizobium sp. SZCCHNS3052]